jgi:hypothetical protein
MQLKQSTSVPNIIFDKYLPGLNLAEIKVLLIIIRQTQGWFDRRTGKRKARDSISQSQFVRKTALSRRIVSSAIKSLLKKKLIEVTDYKGNSLHNSEDRKGRSFLFYSIRPVQITTFTCAKYVPGPVQNSVHNKINYTKETKTKLRGGGVRSVGEVLQKYT